MTSCSVEKEQKSHVVNKLDLSVSSELILPNDTIKKIVRSDEEWKAILTPQQYDVTRLKGTEKRFSGEYWDTKRKGTYHCVCCDLPLFSSKQKYDAGTGWPSFYAPIDEKHIGEALDYRYGAVRTEVLCVRCDAHLGHVFDDGPAPTGLRYCLNSVSLVLK